MVANDLAPCITRLSGIVFSLCKVDGCLSSHWWDFTYLHHLTAQELKKMQIHPYIFSKQTNMWWVKVRKIITNGWLSLISFHTIYFFPFIIAKFLFVRKSYWKKIVLLSLQKTWTILCMCPATEKWCCNVTPSLIGWWTHTQNDPWKHSSSMKTPWHGNTFHDIGPFVRGIHQWLMGSLLKWLHCKK